MNKELLKQQQPVVYQVLSNALLKKRFAHAYLFCGAKNAPKAETALLFAQSLVCTDPDADGFACQTCTSCIRFEKEESIDFFHHHAIGYEKTIKDPFEEKKKKIVITERIKKKDILELQAFFDQTSAEQANRRVYILEDYDQATPDASNSLLKFLEEPTEGVYGILVANEKANILPTIQSRCQIISFRPSLQETDDPIQTMLLNNGYTMAQIQEMMETREFEQIQSAVKEYVLHWNEMEMISHMQREVFVPKSSMMQKKWVRLWVEWLLDIVKSGNISLDLSTRVSLQLLLVEALDILRIPVDLGLFLDHLYNQIRKVVDIDENG